MDLSSWKLSKLGLGSFFPTEDIDSTPTYQSGAIHRKKLLKFLMALFMKKRRFNNSLTFFL